MAGLLDARDKNPVAAAAGRFWADRLTAAGIPDAEDADARD